MKRVLYKGHSYKMFFHRRWHDESRIEIEHQCERVGRDIGPLATPAALEAYNAQDFETYLAMMRLDEEKQRMAA